MNQIKTISEMIDFYLTNPIEDENKLKEELIKSIEFQFKYNDKKLKAELTPPYTFMLQSYQESIYLAYLAINGKREDLRVLKQEEKEALNVKFKLKKGSNIFLQAFENPDLLKGMVDKMDAKQTLIFIGIVFGYLGYDKLLKYLKDKNDNQTDIEKTKIQSEREKKLYETFENITKILPENANFETKREEALLTPVITYEDNELETNEIKINHQQAQEILKSKKTSLPEKETIIIEGVYIIDGIKGLTKDKTNYFLTNNQDEITIILDKSDKNMHLRSKLLQNLNNKVKIKLIIKKENGIIKEKTLESVEDYNE